MFVKAKKGLWLDDLEPFFVQVLAIEYLRIQHYTMWDRVPSKYISLYPCMVHPHTLLVIGPSLKMIQGKKIMT